MLLFLKKVHLFHGLDDKQLASIAAQLQEHEPCEAGETIIRQGEYGETLFFIYKGRVELTYRHGRRSHTLATLGSGDCFGEETVLKQRPYLATAKALQPCHLLVLSRRDLLALLKMAPRLRARLEIAISSRNLARKKRFSWLQPDETMYFLARKHPLQLWKALLRPIFFSIIFLVLVLLFYLFAPVSWIEAVIGIGMFGFLLWAGWNYQDWRNDYYLVTNRRVVWVERVLGIYDSRQESPLTTILSVGVETHQLGRVLDFGDIIVRTFVGRIVFNEVRHPYEVAALIERHWTRSREAAHKEDITTTQRIIREKLYPAQAAPEPEVSSASVAASPPHSPRWRRVLSNFLRVRFEEKEGVITYRKHYIVLLQQTWPAACLSLVALALAFYFWLSPARSAVGGLGWFFMAIAVLGIGWWIYEYVDWSNDKFQVTQDQIFDIDRRPFGHEERKAAALENILSTEHHRRTLWQVLFNYGNVYITVGSTQMVFEDVANPSVVQQDIDQRRLAQLERKRQAETARERERMAEWIAAYHRIANQPSDAPLPNPEPGEEE